MTGVFRGRAVKTKTAISILLLLSVLLVLQACNAGEAEQDECRPPMFGFGAVLVDVRNSGYRNLCSIDFAVGSNSSMATLSDITVTIDFPKEVKVLPRIAYDKRKERVTVASNRMTWHADAIAGHEEKNVGVPIIIRDGVLSKPIVCEAKVTYRQLAGCGDGGMIDGAYTKRVELTTKERRYTDWRRTAQ